MSTTTLYHVTDESNVESILESGLQPQDGDARRLVFLTSSAEKAARVGEIYNNIDEPVVLEAEVMEHNLMEDPEPHGDLDSYAHRGEIPAYNLSVVEGV